MPKFWNLLKIKATVIYRAYNYLSLCGIIHFLSSSAINEPEKNFEYLWKSFDRHYSNFEFKDIDWEKLYSRYRARVTPRTKNNELFKIMVDLLKHLDDKHVYINRFNHVYFSGYDLPILNYFQVLKFDFRLPLKEFSFTRVETLPNGWEYRLSIMKTTNHKGVWLEGKGIDPDILVKNTEDDIKKDVDRVLEKAIDLFVSKLSFDVI